MDNRVNVHNIKFITKLPAYELAKILKSINFHIISEGHGNNYIVVDKPPKGIGINIL